MPNPPHRFTTNGRKLARSGELTWGGSNGWDADLTHVDGVSIVDGSLFPTASVPEGAIHQWAFTEGTGQAITDRAGTADGDLIGAEWTTGAWQGGHALDFGPSESYVETSTWDSFGSGLASDWAIAYTIQLTRVTDTPQQVFRVNQGDQWFAPGQINNFWDYLWDLQDADGKRINISLDTPPRTDGIPQRIVVNKPSQDGTDWGIYYDATQQPHTVHNNDNPTNFSDFIHPVMIGASMNNGVLSAFTDAVIDDIVVWDRSLSVSEIQTDYARQPWNNG